MNPEEVILLQRQKSDQQNIPQTISFYSSSLITLREAGGCKNYGSLLTAPDNVNQLLNYCPQLNKYSIT